MIDFLCSLFLFLRLVSPAPPVMDGVEGFAANRSAADTIPSDIDFGEAAAGYRRDTAIIIPIQDTAELGPISVARENFTLELATDVRQDSVMNVITAFYHPSAPGFHLDTISLGPSNGNRIIILRGRAIRSDLPFDGDSVVDMGSIPVGTTKEAAGLIGLGDLDLLRIDSMEFEGGNGPFRPVAPRSLPLMLSRSSAFSDTIRVRASGISPGISEGTLLIGTNMGSRRIRFRANFTDTGRVYLSYNSDTLDFGSVERKDSAVRELAVVNTRSVPVAVDTVLVNDRGAFSVRKMGPWSVIPPMDSVYLRVTFVPQQNGIYQGRLTVLGDSLSRTVYLFGTGTSAAGPKVDTIYLGEVEMGSADSCIDSTVAIAMRDSVIWTGARVDMLRFTVETDPQLPAIASDTLRVTVGFCYRSGEDSGMVSGNVFLERNIGGETHLLHITARVVPRRSAPRGQIVMLGDTVLRFNQVDTGNCVEQQIFLMNIGDAPARLDSFLLDGARGAFTLVNPPRIPLTLNPNEPFALVVRFCPTEAGPVAGEWRGWQSGAGDPLLRVSLQGTGREVPRPEEPLLLLGDATVRVGEMFRMPLSIEGDVPPGTALESVRLVFNRRSLWFRNAYPAGGTETMTSVFEDDSTLRITAGRVVEGTKLLDLEFIGLSTGREANTVRVADAVLTNIPRARPDTAQVILIGCEFVDAGGFTKKIAITGITADPLSSVVGISYDAPRGMVPSLSLTDISGTRVMTRELPYGTGGPEFVQLPLGDRSPGLYLLELRVGNDRSAVPIMVRGK